MTEEGSGARIARNTIANGLGRFSAVLISLILTPFLIDGLGVEAFGVWAIALSFSFLGGYASLADLGVEAAAARFIAEARSDRDETAEREAASTAMAFFAAAALVLAPTLAALSYPIISAFDISPELRDPAVACLALIAAQLLFELPARTYYAALEGAQRFGLYQWLEIMRALTQFALYAVVLIADLGLVGLGGATAISSLLVLVAAAAMTKRVMPELQIRRRYISRERLRTLVNFGGQYMLMGLMGTIYRQIDKVIIGVALGARFVTTYEVANRIHQGAVMVQSISSSALLPATAYLRANRELLRELFLRGTMYTIACSVPVTAGLAIFAEDLIRTWLGSDQTNATDETRLFLSYLVLVAATATGATMLVALGRMRVVLTLLTIFSVVNLVASIALVGPLEVNGVILGLIIAQAVIWFPYLIVMFREFGVGTREYVRAAIVPQLPGLALQAATAPLLLQLSQSAGNLAFVGLVATASMAISLAGFVFIGVRGSERARLVTTVRAALGLDGRKTGTDADGPPDVLPTGAEEPLGAEQIQAGPPEPRA